MKERVGPEPDGFRGLFTSGSSQVAAFRYSPACGEPVPFTATVVAGSFVAKIKGSRSNAAVRSSPKAREGAARRCEGRTKGALRRRIACRTSASEPASSKTV